MIHYKRNITCVVWANCIFLKIFERQHIYVLLKKLLLTLDNIYFKIRIDWQDVLESMNNIMIYISLTWHKKCMLQSRTCQIIGIVCQLSRIKDMKKISRINWNRHKISTIHYSFIKENKEYWDKNSYLITNLYYVIIQYHFHLFNQ